jgi:hypothetical protein
MTFPQSTDKISYFFATGVWTSYFVPRGAVALGITCLGGGGTGGNGFSRAAGAAGGGGGGGGDGAFIHRLIPARLIPSELFLFVGNGAVAGVNNAQASYVSMEPVITPQTNIINSTGGGNAANGTGTSLGTGGTAGGPATNAYGLMSRIGTIVTSTVNAGRNGGSQAGGAGTSSAIQNGIYNGGSACGGGGSTSADFAGGGVTSGSYLFPPLPGGTAAAPNGLDGYTFFQPYFCTCGGSGGAAINAGVGGNGGRGGYGKGGGGGGAGVTGGTGGAGGQGVIFISVIF